MPSDPEKRPTSCNGDGMAGEASLRTATFGAGCFWGIETAFRRLTGVVETSVGFMGGRLENPSYNDVCIGNTGHAEAVQLRYDPKQINYQKLLEAFWKIHDPTFCATRSSITDSQYRSVIFFHSEQQQADAEESKNAAQPEHRNAIATAIEPAMTFYMAESRHQQFEEKQARRGASGY